MRPPRANPALMLEPQEISLKQLLFLIYARCDYVIKPENKSPPPCHTQCLFFVPVPLKKKAMRTVLVLLQREEGR